jgi:cytidine deaminase
MTSIVSLIPESTVQDLITQANKARDNAYCPYSGYQVGSAILTVSEKIFSGCNVENAAYGSSICAERGAVMAAVSAGEREIKAVVITSVDGSAFPCGSCRQVLNEFLPKERCDLDVILATPEGTEIARTTLSALLPHAFGPRNLSDTKSL